MRHPRYAIPGFPQHVIQRGNNRSALFVDDSDYRFFHDCLRAACERHECRVHAYVFMTNHVHLLVTPTTAMGISRVMQSVGRRYVRRFNDRYQRTGTLWEGRHKATLINSEQYLFACYRYIELNPVRAGMVSDPTAYPWSSFRSNALGERDPLVTQHEQYGVLGTDAGTRQSAYRALFETELDGDTLASIREATNTEWVLGDKRFCDEIASCLGRRGQPERATRWASRNDARSVDNTRQRAPLVRECRGYRRVGMMNQDSDPEALARWNDELGL